MKAFIGHSFDQRDEVLVNKIKVFLKNQADIDWVDGEKAQNKSVSEKVKQRIDSCEIFIGIFTVDKAIKVDKGFYFFRKLETFFTTSNWVIQESGYAIGTKRRLILLVERGVYK